MKRSSALVRTGKLNQRSRGGDVLPIEHGGAERTHTTIVHVLYLPTLPQKEIRMPADTIRVRPVAAAAAVEELAAEEDHKARASTALPLR